MEQKITSSKYGDVFRCVKKIMRFKVGSIYTASKRGRLVHWTKSGALDLIDDITTINEHFEKINPHKSIHDRLKDLQEEAKEQGLKIDAVIEKYVKVGMIGKFAHCGNKAFAIGRLKDTPGDDGFYEDETGVYYACFTPLSENEAIDEIKKLYKK